MNITLCSAFRNGKEYMDIYFPQIRELNQALDGRGDTLYLVMGEGDSTDGTLIQMSDWLSTLYFEDYIDSEIVDVSHGGPEFGSVADPERFKQLAYVWGRIWQCLPADSDVVLYVESDLIWDAGTMVKLIDHLAEYPAVSPAILLHRAGYDELSWYDVWAFRINGQRFAHQPPYHPLYDPDKPFRVDSAGSVMAMRGELARRLKWDDSVWPGVCSQIYALGDEIVCDPKLLVYHQ